MEKLKNSALSKSQAICSAAEVIFRPPKRSKKKKGLSSEKSFSFSTLGRSHYNIVAVALMLYSVSAPASDYGFAKASNSDVICQKAPTSL